MIIILYSRDILIKKDKYIPFSYQKSYYYLINLNYEISNFQFLYCYS